MTTTREDPMGQAQTQAKPAEKPQAKQEAKPPAPDDGTKALLEQVLAGQRVLEDRLAAAEARAEQAEASLAEDANGAVLSKLTDVLEKLGEDRGAAVAGETFKAGESAEDVVRSLEGSVTDSDPGDDQLEHPVTFVAKGANYCCVRKARHRFTTANGEAQVTTGITLDFAPGGVFTTSSKQNADWLRSRPGFNKEFWEQGKEPNAAPSATPVIQRVTAAIVDFDDAELVRLRAEEVAGPNRGDVLTMIDSALARIQNPGD